MESLDVLQLLVVEPDDGWARRIVAQLRSTPDWQVDAVASLDDACVMAARKGYDAVVLGASLLDDPAATFARAKALLPHMAIVAVDVPVAVLSRSDEAFEELADPVLCFEVSAGALPVLAHGNRALGDLLGRPTSGYLAEPDLFWAQVPTEDRADLAAWLASPASTVQRRDVRLLDARGTSVWVEAALSAVEDPAGEVASVTVCLHDTAERRVLATVVAERDAEVRRISGGAPAAVLHLRLWPRMEVVWANGACEDVMEREPSMLQGLDGGLLDAVAPEDVAEVERALQQAVGGEVTTQCRLRASDGRVDLTLRPATRDQVDGVTLVVTATPVPVEADRDRPGVAVEGQSARSHVERRDVGNLVAQLVGTSDVGSRLLTYEGEMAVQEIQTELLERAMAGVLENVRRHTAPGTRVHVTVARAMTGVLVTIRDDGDGMVLPTTVAARHGIIDAEGLLPVAGRGMQSLVAAAQAHGGRATIQVAAGRGTTVRLLLHRAGSQAPVDRGGVHAAAVRVTRTSVVLDEALVDA